MPRKVPVDPTPEGHSPLARHIADQPIPPEQLEYQPETSPAEVDFDAEPAKRKGA